jgi:hypothetical protein
LQPLMIAMLLPLAMMVDITVCMLGSLANAKFKT